MELRKNSDSNIRTFTNALAVYNLDYKNGQVGLKSYLRDSLGRDAPGLLISTENTNFRESALKDSLNWYVPFVNTGNCDIMLSVSYSQAYETKGRLIFNGTYKLFKNFVIGQNSHITIPFLNALNGSPVPDKFIYWIKGNYSNTSKTKIISLDIFYEWTKAQNYVGGISRGEVVDSLKHFFRAHQGKGN